MSLNRSARRIHALTFSLASTPRACTLLAVNKQSSFLVKSCLCAPNRQVLLGVRTYAKYTLQDLVDNIPEPAPSELNTEDLDWSHLQPSKEEEHPADWQPAEQKEDMIFKEVLNHVLANPQPSSTSSASSASSPTASGTPLTDSILALFDRSDRREPQSQLNQPRAKKTGPSPAEVRANRRVKQALAHVYEHIASLQTNKDVMAYFETTVAPAFSTASVLPADHAEKVEPCSALDPLVGPDTAPQILGKCISVLASEFEDPLGAIHLFERSKRRSIEFFSYACSADVYNQIIRIRWHHYRDLYAVVNLAAELAINAIPPTLETTELLASVYRDALDSSKGMGTTPYGMPLWTGQDVRRLEELNRYRTRFQSSWAARPVRL